MKIHHLEFDFVRHVCEKGVNNIDRALHMIAVAIGSDSNAMNRAFAKSGVWQLNKISAENQGKCNQIRENSGKGFPYLDY